MEEQEYQHSSKLENTAPVDKDCFENNTYPILLYEISEKEGSEIKLLKYVYSKDDIVIREFDI